VMLIGQGRLAVSISSHCKHGGFSGASQKRKYVTQVTYGLGGASYIRNNRRTRWEPRHDIGLHGHRVFRRPRHAHCAVGGLHSGLKARTRPQQTPPALPQPRIQRGQMGFHYRKPGGKHVARLGCGRAAALGGQRKFDIPPARTTDRVRASAEASCATTPKWQPQRARAMPE
jgi:hypothetical protein